MGLFKSLSDKFSKKKEELEKKAMERAAEMAVKKSKETAKNAITGVGRKIENALFGSEDEEGARKGEEDDDDAPPPSERPAKKKGKKEEASARAKPAPSAAAKKEKLAADYERFVSDRKAKEEKLEKEVDDDLAALKKRLGKK